MGINGNGSYINWVLSEAAAALSAQEGGLVCASVDWFRIPAEVALSEATWFIVVVAL